MRVCEAIKLEKPVENYHQGIPPSDCLVGESSVVAILSLIYGKEHINVLRRLSERDGCNSFHGQGMWMTIEFHPKIRAQSLDLDSTRKIDGVLWLILELLSMVSQINFQNT